MSVAFYFDHNMQFAVVIALRDRGFDVLTTLDDGHDRQPDGKILDRAQALSRVVVTHDQDFLELASERLASSQDFPGIVFCHLSKTSIGGLVRDLTLIAEVATYDELRNQVVWVVHGERAFNVAFELDQSTESLDSNAVNSIRTKLRIYESYQDTVLDTWLANGKAWERPRFRVAFLTRTIERAYHILALAKRIATNQSRRFIYAATQDSYLGDADPVRTPLFLDHHGRWQALVDLHPTGGFLRPPVRIPRDVEPALPF